MTFQNCPTLFHFPLGLGSKVTYGGFENVLRICPRTSRSFKLARSSTRSKSCVLETKAMQFANGPRERAAQSCQNWNRTTSSRLSPVGMGGEQEQRRVVSLTGQNQTKYKIQQLCIY